MAICVRCEEEIDYGLCSDCDDTDNLRARMAELEQELTEARLDTERLAALLKPVKELRALLGPDGDYSICSATEGEPSMRLVESIIVGCVLEKIDAVLDDAGGEK